MLGLPCMGRPNVPRPIVREPPMSLLKMAPPDKVSSLDELFAIAYAMEHEAAARYAELAEHVRAEGHPQLAQLFEQLAAEERSHEGSVVQWSQRHRGRTPDPAAIRWEIPETFDEEAAGELAASHLATAYRVLSMAVRNEERAFAFWTYIAAEAATPEVREAAEQMAREELRHVALVRRARREAYHAERRAHPGIRKRTPAESLAEAAVLEARLAGRIEELAAQLADDTGVRAHDLAAQTRAMSAEAARLAPGDAGAVEDLDMLATAERLVEDYLDVGDLARDEKVVSEAQSLAKRAITRLAWLRALV